MPDFAVRTAFLATDKMSPVFKQMSRSADMYASHGSRAMNRVSKASSKMKSMFTGMLPIVSGALILRGLNSTIEAWYTQEAAIANVEAGLQSTGNAIGLTSMELQKMAADIQNTGIFGDEVILQNATAQFLTFGNIGKENFDRIQRAAIDVTAKLYGVKASGEQIRATSVMMGKAMDNPIKGLSAMTRVGISFSAEEQKKIKLLAASGNMLDAQKMMLAAIEKQYGGTNAALAKTNKGMELLARNKLGDTMEQVGRQLVPIRLEFFKFASEALPYINEGFKYFVGLLKTTWPLIKVLIGGFIAYKTALMAIAVWKGILAAKTAIMTAAEWASSLALNAETVSLYASATASTAATGGMGAFAASVWAATWPVLALVAAIGALYLGYKALKESNVEFGFGQIQDPSKDPVVQRLKEIEKSKKVTGTQTTEPSFWDAIKRVSPGGNVAEPNPVADKMVAPNISTEDVLRKIVFEGDVNFVNPPDGMTVNTRGKDADKINMNLIGVNP